MKEATISAIRFGFGLGSRDQPAGPAGLLTSLTTADGMGRAFPAMPFAEVKRMLREDVALEPALRDGTPGAEQARVDLRQRIDRESALIERRTFARILDSTTPFRERLTLFWLDHFAIRSRSRVMKSVAADFVDSALRANLTGRFSDLLRAAVLHPWMLLYLDQPESIGPNSAVGRRRGKGLNENLAREVMELHSLGVGGRYTQGDVREFARLLTGHFFRPHDDISFRPGAAEPGAKLIFGQSYGGKTARPEDVLQFLDDLSVHPDTARHIAAKLVVHFVADRPDPDHVAHVERAWIRSGGDLMAVYAALLEHPGAWQPVGGKVRQPLDFVASAMRALGITGSVAMAMEQRTWRQTVQQAMANMGQPFLSPPGPDGWPENAEAWISPAGLAARIRWAGSAPRRLGVEPADPRRFLRHALDDAASQRLTWAVSAAQTVSEGIALVLASPEFNRR